jgi:AcrR family transcriptional regulator
VTVDASDRDTALRSRIIETAVTLTVDEGWAAVTMSRLAEEVGVSRQTVYNEVGTKPALAEAMVNVQLAVFLGLVEEAFDRHDEPAAAVRAATRAVLELAERNALLRAIVSSTQGVDTDLLPLLTTRSEVLLGAAKSVLDARLTPATPHLSRRERSASVDVIVRAVLGHVVQPSGTPRRTAGAIGWTAERLLAAPPGLPR